MFILCVKYCQITAEQSLNDTKYLVLLLRSLAGGGSILIYQCSIFLPPNINVLQALGFATCQVPEDKVPGNSAKATLLWFFFHLKHLYIHHNKHVAHFYANKSFVCVCCSHIYLSSAWTDTYTFVFPSTHTEVCLFIRKKPNRGESQPTSRNMKLGFCNSVNHCQLCLCNPVAKTQYHKDSKHLTDCAIFITQL